MMTKIEEFFYKKKIRDVIERKKKLKNEKKYLAAKPRLGDPTSPGLKKKT